jgi:predicted kinase
VIEVLVGMIGSGKSTWARKRAEQGWVVINEDSIVTAVHGGAYKQYDNSLKALYKAAENTIFVTAVALGRNVCIDRTNTTAKTRARWIALAHSLDQKKIDCVVFPMHDRATHAARRCLSDDRGYSMKEWEKVFNRHMDEYQHPSVSEGFRFVIELTGEGPHEPPQMRLVQSAGNEGRAAERSVLGSMLRDNTVIDDVAHLLKTEQFYVDAHQKIYSAILGLHEKGGPADLVTLADRLKAKDQIADIGGYEYIAGLWDAAPTAANAEYYASIVRDYGLRRSLIHMGNEIIRDAHDGAGAATELVEQAERSVFEIAKIGMAGTVTPAPAIVAAVYDRIDKRAQARRNGCGEIGVPTGFLDIDPMLGGGLQDGELSIIAARPSVGKTSFGMTIAPPSPVSVPKVPAE